MTDAQVALLLNEIQFGFNALGRILIYFLALFFVYFIIRIIIDFSYKNQIVKSIKKSGVTMNELQL